MSSMLTPIVAVACMFVSVFALLFVPHYHGNGQYQWG